MLGNALGRALHIADIRLLVLVKRRRYTDRNRINVADKIKIRGSTQETCLHHVFELVADNIADIVVAGINRIHLFGLYVKANRLITGLCHLHGKRQAYIAQTYNTDNGGLVRNFPEQLLFHIRHSMIPSFSL